MGKKRVGALEKVDADLFVLFLSICSSSANSSQRQPSVQNPTRPKVRQLPVIILAEHMLTNHSDLTVKIF